MFTFSPLLKYKKLLSFILLSPIFLTACTSTSTSFINKNLSISPISQPVNDHAILRHEYRLDNGLKVIIQADHRSPTVISQIWYGVGSTDEPKGLGGISHLLEHLMFKGTQKVSATDFERIIAKFGGSNNAFTSHDYTGYYEIFPANRLSLALELEADRMTNLQLTEADFLTERQVVMEERRQRIDDNPTALAFEQFSKMAYPNSNRGNPVIGSMADIEAITLNDLKNWYKTWYVPNNATLVIVGDVNPDEALAEVKKYFAHIPAKPFPKTPNLSQKGFRGYQEKTIQLPVQVPNLIMAYNVPTFTTAKDQKIVHNLMLLADVLDGGLSARLEKRLVREKQLLASVGSGYNGFARGDGLFLIQATPRDNISLDEAKQAILAEIDALKTEKIDPKEIQRAKTNTMTGLIYSQDSISGQAQMIGSLNVIGLDDRMIYELPIKFDKIQEHDLHQVAKQFFSKDNLTVLNVQPNDEKK